MRKSSGALATSFVIAGLAACAAQRPPAVQPRPRGDAGAIPAEFEKACDQGDAAACYKLAVFLREGRGGSVDFVRVAELYGRACDGGEAQACNGLGHLYQDGLGVPQDERRAIKLFEKACEGGSALGCGNLGVAYQTGQGVDPDPDRATSLLKKACAMGAATACSGPDTVPKPRPPLPTSPEPRPAPAPAREACMEYTPVGSHIPVRDCPGDRVPDAEPPRQAKQPRSLEALDALPRLCPWTCRLGLRGEGDLLQPGFVAAIQAELGGDSFSAAAAVILRLPPGIRLEGRSYFLQLDPFRLYAGLGSSVFFPAVAGRAVIGVDGHISRIHLSGDVAFEHFFNPAPGYGSNAVLLSLGAGWRL